mmetsp:Transcript_12963/g.24364  ORF Transcript_12963/g.24364 Transcript_12963/m.24364 type:complete len:508 (-) Transcript_12963:140-1663(-)|eukprot:CAMPEP_0176489508 /NCGR_PEP_ID=MMETSP0200_2-20121128/7328_1 /TAXON_ID=947934 /ORGANISM="Chaetoceros sp., Strain GSL56" /LENGTH=507 /DNA_ID=CAMNT_0017886659 /DNA_START=159 /DNA_END=1682 /DNA_ORIENTATION=+
MCTISTLEKLLLVAILHVSLFHITSVTITQQHNDNIPHDKLVTSTNFYYAHAFVLNPVQLNIRRTSPISFAKPPPSARFDLDAIEALEAELDYQERLRKDIGDDKNGQGERLSGHGDDWDPLLNDRMEVTFYEVSPELHNQRIDLILSEMMTEISRSQCGSLVSEGMVAIQTPQDKEAGREPTILTRKSIKLEKGTILQVKHVVDDIPTEIMAQNLPLDILYEDEHMIVLNKAAGMVVHPAIGNWEGTVVNALAYYLANESPFGSGDFIGPDGTVSPDQVEGISMEGTDGEAVTFRPGIVHRLDKGTTGILVVAKTRMALTALSEAFANRQVKKTYVAVTVGNPGRRVVIDKPIGRHPIHRQRMRVVPNAGTNAVGRVAISNSQVGRSALSFVDTLAFDGKLSLAQVRIETGRTHQIRVHLQDRTTPIYGDDVYGFGDWNQRLAKSHGIQRPLLHAFKLELKHPVTGKKMIFRAPMADDMINIVKGVWPDGENDRPDLFQRYDVEVE